ncbi:MAG: hypothetical protein OEO83_03835 [Alphaproteobacteria bacterium]|nr:hypothetical protein [Alphaproteobacteria bacterium]
MKMRVYSLACTVLLLALAGCAGGDSASDSPPEKKERGLDNMMAPTGSPYVGGRPGAGAGGLMGPGTGFMVPPQRGRALTRAEVSAEFRYQLNKRGDGQLKIGSVIDKDKDTVRIELVTPEGYPAARYEVDRWTGLTRRVR